MSNAIIIPEVQIDFENLHDAKVMENYVKTELLLDSVVSENPVMLCVYDVPENKLGAIRRRVAIEKFSKGTVKVINNTRDAVVGAADFAAYRVVAPVAQAGIKATAGVAKVVAKTALATGATLVGSTLENARKTGSELKTDPEVIHAKSELSGAWKTLRGLFVSEDNNSSIRVIKEEIKNA